MRTFTFNRSKNQKFCDQELAEAISQGLVCDSPKNGNIEARQLTALYLSETSVTSYGLERIHAPNLETLEFGRVAVDQAVSSEEAIAIHAEDSKTVRVIASNFPKLSALSLPNRDFGSLGDLIYLPLQTLDLHGANVEDSDLEAIAEIETLKVIYLSLTKVTASGLTLLYSLKNLERLDIRGLGITQSEADGIRAKFKVRHIMIAGGEYKAPGPYVPLGK